MTLYFWWQNIKGISESSEKALWIMQLTTVMVVALIGWCGYTLLDRGERIFPRCRCHATILLTSTRSDGSTAAASPI